MAKQTHIITGFLFLAAACFTSAQIAPITSNSGQSVTLKPGDIRLITSLIGAP